MNSPFELSDSLGPEKVVYIQNPSVGLKAIVAVDNTACGPAVGGCRMATDVSLEECMRLARAMTLKNASAGLPHGGAKSVIFASPDLEPKKKEQLIRAYACALDNIKEYIVGPDMGTNEHLMAIIHDEIGRSVGLPREIGGIPLDEIGATGWGVCVAAKSCEEFTGIALQGATFVIQGFGAVGYHAARFLEQEGAVMVGACDSKSAVFRESGISVQALHEHKSTKGSIKGFEDCESSDRDTVIDMPCDIWVPAARPDIITTDNVERLRTRLIVQGANIPIQREAEDYLHQQGVLSIPDYIANAGGVICAAVEYRNGSENEAMNLIQEKISTNTRLMLERCKADSVTPRTAADTIAMERLKAAECSRRFR